MNKEQKSPSKDNAPIVRATPGRGGPGGISFFICLRRSASEIIFVDVFFAGITVIPLPP